LKGSRGKKRMAKKQSPMYKWVLSEIRGEVQIHPHYADLQNHFALLLMAGGEMEKAEGHFLEALRLNPTYREALLNLGFLYIETKRWREAEKIFLTEVKRHPKDGFLHHILGILSLQTGKKKKAMARIRRVMQHPSPYRDFYQKKGLWKKGKIILDRKAERVLKKNLLSYPHAQYHNFIGLCLAKKGRSAPAVKELRKAARLKPDEMIFHANLGTVYYYQGAYARAAREYQKALEIDPTYGPGYAHLSYALSLMSRAQEAVTYMRKAVQINPRYADLHYNLALLHSDRRQYKEAISELREALRINPDYLFARINLGVLYEDQKKWKEAKREYRRILQMTPDDEHIRRRLERIS
jgi:superkiller protein 3